MARKLSPRTRLHRQLSSASRPVYIVDSARTVAFCNAACAAWTGVPEASLMGIRCDYHSVPRQDPLEALSAALCPPPEAFAGRTVTTGIRLPGDGDGAVRQARFLPLGLPEEAVVGVLVWVGERVGSEATQRQPAGPDWDPARLHDLLRDLRRSERRRYDLPQLVGQTAVMRRVREQVRLEACGAGRVVIVGPPGSGREHVARAIHHQRDEADVPLIPLACDLLDAELLESAIAGFLQQLARSEGGRRGTLLLLDVDRLPPQAQARLFGALAAEGELRTLATSAVPWKDLLGGEIFRTDLAYGLGTLVVELPPLAKREEDIALLAQWFVEAANAAGGRQWSGFTAEAMELLVAYDWPGNVDELSQVVTAATRDALGPSIRAEDLPEKLRFAQRASERPRRVVEAIELDEFLAGIESELIRRALRQAKGNKTRAAKLLGLNRARFHRRLVQLGLDD